MKALLVKDDSLIYAAEVPEEPKRNYETDFQVREFEFKLTYEKYREAIASAKESAVLVADQVLAKDLITKYGFFWPKPGIYAIEGWEWSVVDAQVARVLSTGNRHKQMPLKGEVAILKESTLSTEQESQEEKLIKLINLYWTFDDNQRHTHSWHDKQDCIEQIRTHFTITRK